MSENDTRRTVARPLRAAVVLLDHNGYHAGQLVALRRALGAWG